MLTFPRCGEWTGRRRRQRWTAVKNANGEEKGDGDERKEGTREGKGGKKNEWAQSWGLQYGNQGRLRERNWDAAATMGNPLPELCVWGAPRKVAESSRAGFSWDMVGLQPEGPYQLTSAPWAQTSPAGPGGNWDSSNPAL